MSDLVHAIPPYLPSDTPQWTLGAGDTRHPSVIGADLCNFWGVEPDLVAEIRQFYHHPTRQGAIEFWGHNRIPDPDAYWAYEAEAPTIYALDRANPLRLVARFVYDVSLTSTIPEFAQAGVRW